MNQFLPLRPVVQMVRAGEFYAGGNSLNELASHPGGGGGE